MSDYFVRMDPWVAIAVVVVIGVIGGILIWAICSGEKKPKPRDPWDWRR